MYDLKKNDLLFFFLFKHSIVPLNFFTSFFDGIWYIAISFKFVVQKTCWLNVVGAILNAPSAHGMTDTVIDGTVDIHDDNGTNIGALHDSHHSWAWTNNESICSL